MTSVIFLSKICMLSLGVHTSARPIRRRASDDFSVHFYFFTKVSMLVFTFASFCNLLNFCRLISTVLNHPLLSFLGIF